MMVLYSGTTCPFSQRCRLVLFEKGMDFEVRDVDLFNKPEDISTMNPYGQVPILVERELILYESNIINEYIDERFPHPQLMPADPLMRARARLMLFNFEKELFVHVNTLENERSKVGDKSHDKARAEIRDRLTTLAPLFLKNKYMLGDEFSMLDVAIAPLLWRLDHYGIELSKTAAPLMKYAERIFSRPAYIEALTPSEKVMRRGWADTVARQFSTPQANRSTLACNNLFHSRSRTCQTFPPSRTCCAPSTSGARTAATRHTWRSRSTPRPRFRWNT